MLRRTTNLHTHPVKIGEKSSLLVAPVHFVQSISQYIRSQVPPSKCDSQPFKMLVESVPSSSHKTPSSCETNNRVNSLANAPIFSAAGQLSIRSQGSLSKFSRVDNAANPSSDVYSTQPVQCQCDESSGENDNIQDNSTLCEDLTSPNVCLTSAEGHYQEPNCNLRSDSSGQGISCRVNLASSSSEVCCVLTSASSPASIYSKGRPGESNQHTPPLSLKPDLSPTDSKSMKPLLPSPQQGSTHHSQRPTYHSTHNCKVQKRPREEEGKENWKCAQTARGFHEKHTKPSSLSSATEEETRPLAPSAQFDRDTSAGVADAALQSFLNASQDDSLATPSKPEGRLQPDVSKASLTDEGVRWLWPTQIPLKR